MEASLAPKIAPQTACIKTTDLIADGSLDDYFSIVDEIINAARLAAPE
jgi:hypothetical protein